MGISECLFIAYRSLYDSLLLCMQDGPELPCVSSLDAAHKAALDHLAASQGTAESTPSQVMQTTD